MDKVRRKNTTLSTGGEDWKRISLVGNSVPGAHHQKHICNRKNAVLNNSTEREREREMCCDVLHDVSVKLG